MEREKKEMDERLLLDEGVGQDESSSISSIASEGGGCIVHVEPRLGILSLPAVESSTRATVLGTVGVVGVVGAVGVVGVEVGSPNDPNDRTPWYPDDYDAKSRPVSRHYI